MPRKRRNAGSPTSPRARRSLQKATASSEAIPDVYKDMLVEAYHTNPADFQPEIRQIKRRKLSRDALDDYPRETSPALSRKSSESIQQSQQIVYDDFEGSDESDVEFEDVDLGLDVEEPESDEQQQQQPDHKSILLDLSKGSTATQKASIRRRKPVGKVERQFRLDVHKWHVLCLLIHVAIRNKWCDDEEIQSILKPLVPRKVISLLHTDESKLQSQRNFAFNNGLEELCGIWRLHWKINTRGMRKAVWKEAIDMDQEVDEAEDPVDLEDFKIAAKECNGSRDLGAQLFCALLRSIAVEARLICSLQVLPFSGIAKGDTPQKPQPHYIRADPQDYGQSPTSKTHRRAKKKRIVDSPYPVFWVEVYNPATTQWMPVDPIVRHTINKPRTGFEPPASDTLNSMTYVIAFEDDGSAKDVTRRYVTWYNAKTRRSRVESTKDGEEWWRRVELYFRKRIIEPRDEIEEGTLVKRVATEGMPKNVQDFRNHPVYVLERHLKSNEVIEPKREVGKVTTGAGKNYKVESVYRRQDVHICRSADAWYRRGRDVSQCEQPLKRVTSRNQRRDRNLIPAEDEIDDESDGVALYAEYQTEMYVPPPIVGGRVPRNAFGNLDVYVSSMIPAGGVHIQHPFAARAAKAMRINYSDAVTGFRFKGRQGTAIVEGIVIDQQYTAAIIAVIEGLEEQATQDTTEHRFSILSSIWKRMLAALRVRERIQKEYGEKQDSYDAAVDDEEADSTSADDEGGGFMLNTSEATDTTKTEEAINLATMKERLPTVLPDMVVKQPVIVVRSPHKQEKSADEKGRESDLFSSEDEEAEIADVEGGFLRDDLKGSWESSVPVNANDREGVGGFMDEVTSEHDAGGFIPEIVEDQNSIIESSLERESLKSPDANTAMLVTTEDKGPEELPTTEHVKNTADDSVSDGVDSENKDEQQKARILSTRSEQDSDSLSQSSLLSHDPEEDDTEPQWLEDAFDSD